jgi:glucose 1-dehydrogenase
MKLAGKKALVTGAARGIGQGCALELAKAGADVAINDLTRSANAEDTVAQIRALGREAHVIEGDAFERASCESIVQRALAALGRIDILVSNPAFSRRQQFLQVDPDIFEKTLKGTLSGNFHMSQLVARHMVERGGGGKIVFISSVHHRIPFVNSVAYNAGKSGLMNLAYTIAAELLPHRINVNAIEPGWIDTPGEHETFGDEMLREAGSKLPWGRLGTIHDIGRAATFLCSDDADYVTGTSLLVDGGLWLRSAVDENEQQAK